MYGDIVKKKLETDENFKEIFNEGLNKTLKKC